MNNRFKQFVLLIGDIAIMNLALYLALWLRYGDSPALKSWQENWGPFAIIFIFWLIAFYISNLYDLHSAINNGLFFRRVAQSFIIGSVLAVIFFYIAPPHNITPKTNLLIFIAVFAVLFAVWRQAFNGLLKSYLPRANIAVIGYNNLVEKIISELKQKPQLGLALSFIIDEKSAAKEIDGTPVFNDLKELPALIAKRKINNIILAAAPDSQELRTLLFECLPLKITFTNLADFYENISGKIPLEVISKMWFLENLSEGDKSNFDSFKRATDLILALLIFIISLPFWLIIGLVIKLESRGPIFYRSRRCGQGGQEFKMIKFRTMRTENNHEGMTEVDDQRITRFGNFLRQTRLDELPQTLNIIRGEMSFVGPRPERPEFVAILEKQIPFYRERMLVKPGITGSDQISGEYHSPSCADTIKKLQYDLYYVKNRSLYLDTSIILKTISTVLSRAGR